MATFVIEPHFRLQEWVAEEKGYFAAEGLDYVFRELVQATDGQIHDRGDRIGAYQSLEAGRAADVSCACHWTVGVAASAGHGKLYPDAYSVAPAGIFVPADSPVRSPEQLAGVPISVGYQSGSHYSTIQALEPYLPADQLQLSFNDGMLFRRMELLIEGQSPAAALFSGPYYFAEQLGFRKIIDTTFMITTMIHGQPAPEDLAVLPGAAARAARHRRPARSLHALLPERVPGPLPSPHGHPPLGPRRAPGVRALHEGGLRPDGPVDRRAGHLRRGHDGLVRIRAVDRGPHALGPPPRRA